MHVYTLESDADSYQNLSLVDEEKDWQMIYQFDGASLSQSWEPLKVEVYAGDGNRFLPEGDFPSLFSHLPVFSSRAAKKLEPVLKGNGEFLALECKQGDYVAFNVTNMIDALNVERSDIVYFASGKVLAIERFVFKPRGIPASGVFKIPQRPLGEVFVTDIFVRIVHEFKLRGFLFSQVEITRGDV